MLFWGWRMSLNRLTFKTVTATQTANAMKDDSFYSNYNENTLVIHGVVSSVTNQNNDLVIGLKTNFSIKRFGFRTNFLIFTKGRRSNDFS